MKYKITFRNQFKSLESLIIGTLLFFIAGWYFYNKIGFGVDINTIQYFFIYYLILLIATLFLHVEYYLINKNDIVIIDKAKDTIAFNNQKLVAFIDIEKIILVMSPVLYRNGTIGFFPTDDYHFAIIKMKDGDHFIFTCLMAYKVGEAMKNIQGVSIEKYRRFIPSTLLLPRNIAGN
jgi:hypothetical protein